MNAAAPSQAAQLSSEALTGIGIAESAIDLRNGIANGSWVEGGLALASTGLEALSLAVDPLGTLAEYAFSWVIEHCGPLRQWLDWLAGDVGRITAYAGTWHAVAKTVAEATTDFTTEVDGSASAWRGDASKDYRASIAKHVAFFSASQVCASTIGTTVEVVGALVGVVREAVRDIISRAVATLIVRVPFWAAAASVPVFFATVPVATQVTTLVERTVLDITDLTVKLARSLDRLRPLMTRLNGIWELIDTGLRNLRKADTGGEIKLPDAVKQSGVTTPAGAGGGSGGGAGGGGNTVTSNAGSGGNHATVDQPTAGGGGQGDPPPPGGTNPPPGPGGPPRPPSRRADLDKPHRELTPEERSRLSSHLIELEARYPEKYNDTVRDPDHGGRVNPSSQDEARVALDLRERGQLTENYARPSERGNGDFIDDGKKWDIKRPREPYDDKDFRVELGRQIGTKDRYVVIDTREVAQQTIDKVAQTVQDPRWRNRVIWYP
ncbi:WXG100 family type VII secretion target [Lentzea sp. HUAS TT2]|uniref:WXG100 family type VII secretion target n=1 Tax=Lentzea sp. HUAS TT2 TaxID=3447454 RepID=UPI003F6E8CC9